MKPIAAAFFALALLGGLRARAGEPAGQVVPVWSATVLEVDVDTGGARFTPVAESTKSGVVHINAIANGPVPSTLPVQWTRAGKRIIVTVGRGSGGSILPFVPRTQLAYDVTYPAGLQLVVHAFTGNIAVEHPSSQTQVTVSQGDVTIDAPRAPVLVDDAQGDVTVSGALAGIDLASDRGDVTADLAPNWLPRPIRMESALGDLRLTVSPGFRARVDASTSAGTVHDGLSSAMRGAKDPPVWLYTEKGDVWLATPHP
ncbi:MAG TPA: hypothetical protein VMH02_03890 [Verrucomicrobiae bacterium]|nr:hypothetical protein [Verrucomicrobiae bacterium]